MQVATKSHYHTIGEWEKCEETKVFSVELERERAENLIGECDRLIKETDDLAEKGSKDIDKKLDQRIWDIRYWAEELDTKLGNTNKEADKVEDYMRRIERAIDGLIEPLHITEKCLVARKARQECELTNDEVDKNLRKEIDMYNRLLELLRNAYAQAKEQLRLDRKAIHQLKLDATSKDKAKTIDENAKELKENFKLCRFGPITCNVVSPEEWQAQTMRTLEYASNTISDSVRLRDLIDGLLKQVASDQKEQVETTNLAMKRRTQDMRESKGRMEEHLNRILQEISNLEDNAIELEKSIEDRKRALELTKNRICTRAQRPGIENAHDEPAQRLLMEVNQLTNSISALEHRLAQTNDQLCKLRRVQLQVEETIQRKEEALFIDFVECPGMRSSISITTY